MISLFIKCVNCKLVFKRDFEPFTCPGCRSGLRLNNINEIDSKRLSIMMKHGLFKVFCFFMALFFVINTWVDFNAPNELISIYTFEVSKNYLVLFLSSIIPILIAIKRHFSIEREMKEHPVDTSIIEE